MRTIGFHKYFRCFLSGFKGARLGRASRPVQTRGGTSPPRVNTPNHPLLPHTKTTPLPPGRGGLYDTWVLPCVHTDCPFWTGLGRAGCPCCLSQGNPLLILGASCFVDLNDDSLDKRMPPLLLVSQTFSGLFIQAQVKLKLNYPGSLKQNKWTFPVNWQKSVIISLKSWLMKTEMRSL